MMRSSLRPVLQAIAAIALAAAFPVSAAAGAWQAPAPQTTAVRLESGRRIRIYRRRPQFQCAATGTITNGTTRPEGVWIDGKGILYLENGPQYPAQADIEEYKPGATSPFFKITDGLNSPGAVAVGSDGTVYVNQLGEAGGGGVIGVVAVYPAGKTKLERTISLTDAGIRHERGGMAFDQQGNLYAATIGNATEVHVFKIAPGSSQATDLGLQGYGGSAIAIDGAGNLYAGGGGASSPCTLLERRSPSRNHSDKFLRVWADRPSERHIVCRRRLVVAEYAPVRARQQIMSTPSTAKRFTTSGRSAAIATVQQHAPPLCAQRNGVSDSDSAGPVRILVPWQAVEEVVGFRCAGFWNGPVCRLGKSRPITIGICTVARSTSCLGGQIMRAKAIRCLRKFGGDAF